MTTVTKAKNIIKKHKILFAILVVISLFLLANFIYINIVVPWPYREALEACLSNSKNFSTEEQIKEARNICFRTYPHFN